MSKNFFTSFKVTWYSFYTKEEEETEKAEEAEEKKQEEDEIKKCKICLLKTFTPKHFNYMTANEI